ncbi:tautomerase family protein [Streptomyces chartreusis]|uniref:tautomerase family protein n=1 Tax=Streptomyces chartreusis TaxID=1969 RepID=UPI0033DFAA1C
MPLYEFVTTAGTLTDEQRQTLAAEITRIHCGETGAPFEFVHVVFPELPKGLAYTAGRPGSPMLIRGQIRAGRSIEVRHSIMNQIYELVRETTNADPMSIIIAVVDFEPSHVMEGGFILPSTNAADEEAWIAAVSKAHGSAADVNNQV